MSKVNAAVVLKTGDKFEAVFDADREFSASSLTKDTVHLMELTNGHRLVVQGDSVLYIMAKP